MPDVDRSAELGTLPHGIAPPSHRLPPTTRIGRVRLAVADLERSIAWYERVLGLGTLDRTSRRAVLGSRADRRPLIELHEEPGATPVPRRGRLGLYHFAILLPDRNGLGRFLRHLADLGLRPGAADHAVSEALYLNDPDGLGIEVYADRPRSSWRIDGGELRMTSDPLDLEGLIRAGEGEAWSAMPAGTIVGHVHLHVGELDTASGFYHEALGFDKVVWSYPGALFFSAGGYHHHLGTNTWAARAERAAAGDARLLEWELVVPSGEDVENAARSLAQAGYGIEHREDGAAVADPWGTLLLIRSEP